MNPANPERPKQERMPCGGAPVAVSITCADGREVRALVCAKCGEGYDAGANAQLAALWLSLDPSPAPDIPGKQAFCDGAILDHKTGVLTHADGRTEPWHTEEP